MARKDCCFLCRFLSKSDIMGCELDDTVEVNIWNIMGDIKPVVDCPLKKEGGITMEYKGFKTTNVVKEPVDEKEDKWKYSVKVENASRVLIVEAPELEDLNEEFHRCIDKFLEICEEYKMNPFQE